MQAIPLSDSAEPRLSEAMREAATASTDRSCVYALSIAPEAFAARVVLARAAERSIDAQYYIWHGDTTGHLLLEELWNAAERGVQVRLLLDDNGIVGMDPTLAALNSHHNFQVRLFNPFQNRHFKALGYLTEFERLNRRMHNKSFTADSQATIVGGRNVGDEYFGAGQAMEFADLDVLAVGPAARDVTVAFEQYWNCDAARPVEALLGEQPPNVAAMLARFAAVRACDTAVVYFDALRTTPLIEALLASELRLERARTQLLYDPPIKVKGKAPDADLVFAHLSDALGAPERGIDLVSPYLVPGSKGTKALAHFAAQGIAVRILTNSLAATDVAVVHAGYAKRRKPLLRRGVRIYELMAAFSHSETHARWQHGIGSSSASLHAKTFSVDRRRVFVGSLNLDPRSIRLNTEMGLVIESAALAEAIASEFDEAVKLDAYEVILAADGQLEWVEPGGEVRHRREPNTTFLKRLIVRLLAWLPIEWLL